MHVFVVSKEKELLGSLPECAEDLTTNLKVFQHIKDAITFVKSFNYLADDLSLDSMVSQNGEEADFWTAEDVYQAWIIDYYIRLGELTEYLNGGNWSVTNQNGFVGIITWGIDKNKKFANSIQFNYGITGSASAPKKMQQKAKCTKTDKNYPILDKGEVTVFKMK